VHASLGKLLATSFLGHFSPSSLPAAGLLSTPWWNTAIITGDGSGEVDTTWRMQCMGVTLALLKLLLMGIAVAVDLIHRWSLRRLRQAVRVLVRSVQLEAAGDGARFPGKRNDGRSFVYSSALSASRLQVTELDSPGCATTTAAPTAWKERDRRTFDRITKTPSQLIALVLEEADGWITAGFNCLASLTALLHSGRDLSFSCRSISFLS
jgi:hypothetical protein